MIALILSDLLSKPENFPRTQELDLPTAEDTSTGIVDSFRLTWHFRKNLSLSLASYPGVTLIPSTLFRGRALQDSYWDNWRSSPSRLSIMKGADVKLIIGNGEGELTQNLDPQQYGGFEANIEVMKVYSSMGLSIDGNSQGSEQNEWFYNTTLEDTSLFPERYGLLSIPDNDARGQRTQFHLAWQRSRSTDLDKDTLAIPTTLPYAEDRIDVANLLLESPDKANEITRTVLSASLSYKILDQYTVAADESRSIDTDAVYFFELRID